MNLLTSLLAVVSIIQIGLIVEFYLDRKGNSSLIIPSAFGLGLGTLTISILLLNLIGFYLTRFTVILTVIILFSPYIFNQDLKIFVFNNLKKYYQKVKETPIFVTILFILFVVFLSMFTFSKSVWGYDAYERWLAKGRTFWVDGGINKQNVAIYDPSDDHNLWPLTITWFYYLVGDSNELWIRIIPLFLLFMLSFEFWGNLNSTNFKRTEILWFLILIFTPFLWQTVSLENYSANADLPVSFFIILAISKLLKKQFIYGALFLGFAAFTKNDTLPVLIGFIICLPIIFRKEIFNSIDLKIALIAAICLLAFNITWKIHYALNSRYFQQDFSQLLSQKPFLKYNKYSLNAFREQLRQTQVWGLGWWIILFFLIKNIKEIIFSKSMFLIIALITLQFLGYFIIYYITKEDQATQISTSISRVLLQVYPALLLVAYHVSKIQNNRKILISNV